MPMMRWPIDACAELMHIGRLGLLMPSASPSHRDLIDAGAIWLRRAGFPVVAKELRTTGSRETADVIGFRQACSALLEAKASRSDFLAERKKPFRTCGAALGVYRFYLCQPGVIEADEVPQRWGLLHLDGSTVVAVRAPVGNLWPTYGSGPNNWREYQHESDISGERSLLFSIARRR